MTAFARFGLAGLALALATGSAVTVLTPRDPGGLTIAVLAAATVVVTVGIEGRRRGTGLVFLHLALAFLAADAALSALAGRPVLADLDLAAVLAATAHAVGRLGCAAVGCCHGRPHVGGIAYRRDQVAEGFPPHLLGVPLFPVQRVEAAIGAALAAACVVLVVTGAPPGSAVGTWAVGYGVARLGLEELRGDDGRRQLGPLSEAQWTALALVGAFVALELGGTLPLSDAHLALAAGGVGVWGVHLATAGRERRLLRPGHLHEVARMAAGGRLAEAGHAAVRGDAGLPAVVRTTDGVVLSWLRTPGGDPDYDLVAFSSPGAPLDLRAARRMARPLRALFGLPDGRLGRGDAGVFFLLADRTASPSNPGNRRAH